jgi:hypothetical protein
MVMQKISSSLEQYQAQQQLFHGLTLGLLRY